MELHGRWLSASIRIIKYFLVWGGFFWICLIRIESVRVFVTFSGTSIAFERLWELERLLLCLYDWERQRGKGMYTYGGVVLLGRFPVFTFRKKNTNIHSSLTLHTIESNQSISQSPISTLPHLSFHFLPPLPLGYPPEGAEEAAANLRSSHCAPFSWYSCFVTSKSAKFRAWAGWEARVWAPVKAETMGLGFWKNGSGEGGGRDVSIGGLFRMNEENIGERINWRGTWKWGERAGRGVWVR